MWPFKKKHPPLSELPREALWDVVQGEYNGSVLIARVNASAQAFRGHPELDHQVGIAVPFLAPTEHGLPGDQDTAGLNELEDALVPLFEHDGNALLVTVITTQGMREFVLYSKDPRESHARFEKLKASVSSGHEVQLMIQPDPEWKTYARFR